MYKDTTARLLNFIEESTDCFHTINEIKRKLSAEGFEELSEGGRQRLMPGRKYFVTRNLSSIIAFALPRKMPRAFMITACHSESPCFKLKPHPELKGKLYTRLNTERYGGMIYSSWLDRPLSVSGRITVDTQDGIETRLVKIDRDLLVIPNAAIHLNSKINGGYEYKPQRDLIPVLDGGEGADLTKIIAENAMVDPESIVGSELFLYNRCKGTIWGAEDEFFSAPRIDDLQCAFALAEAFVSATDTESEAIPLYCVFDNEEVGSGTKQGACSTFLYDVLHRIIYSYGMTDEDYMRMTASGMMLSADNGHAVHPNLPELSDGTLQPVMNGGILIKYNAAQKYTTDAVSDGIFRKICNAANVPVQEYANRSDLAGGSTLGNLSAEKVSVNTIDIGLAQLAMHSAYETAGVYDTFYMKKAAETFYRSEINAERDGRYILKIVD